ncbi:phosphoadenosine phosphosulfate reductase family protein [Siphonobacter sp. SORGH_AS_1065]|uniref:phosphoadenosine phosphosulfate reductase domain-containing protein n=1 Tax=Siphonobacter sp. SORGH_AS_1065 TaxID=3041795 RepID=UPI002789132B|nr:phosphoadenosine phosphosulfate reductase family protein [Siphonobacter sp. SORGH_AS_1065]MDQ1089014.1 hypothetical protein [Siphonobacter sp. SORGH_AS_1065]
MKTLIISFSGGRTSAFMAKFLKERYPERQIIVVFANTGKENEATLKFVNRCDKDFDLNVVWLEYEYLGFKRVTFETASRNGEPFEAMIQRYGIPNKAFPHCTRELKNNPIRRYLRYLGLKNNDYETAIGIRWDERHRISKNSDSENLIYPLATDIKVDEAFIRNWWSIQPFDLQLRDYEGNCDFCWKKSIRKKMTIAVINPDKAVWWQEMEVKYSQINFKNSLFEPPFYFHQKNISTADIISMTQKPFDRVYDKHEITPLHLDIDSEMQCFCKSS